MTTSQRILVTGSAGFIGYHVCQRLLAMKKDVVGVDNFSPYYDPQLKEDRTALLQKSSHFTLHREDICDRTSFSSCFESVRPDVVIHLAAQPGVRYSVEHPDVYVATNLVGSFHLLELCRRYPPKHLLFASTSAVYGANPKLPFHETDALHFPLSLYAATKAGGEQMAHCYAHLYNIPTTIFRFFTVYGPWVRPDMALYKFTKAMLSEESISIYNNGNMKRDFTYVEDLVDAVVRLMDVVPGSTPVTNDSLSPVAPYRVVNLGHGQPVSLMTYIAELERAFGVTAKKEFLPHQMGDLVETAASPNLVHHLLGDPPHTPLSEGIKKFVEWYRAYYNV